MQAPMIGSWKVRVHGVKPFAIHGDLYYELHVTREEDGANGLAIRVPQHAVAGQPVAGDVLEVTFLMGQVTAAKKI